MTRGEAPRNLLGTQAPPGFLYTNAILEGTLKSSKRASVGKASLGVLTAFFLSSCASAPAPDQPMAVKAEKPFASGGSIEMQLDGGNYEIRPASGDQIRVSFGGNTGSATAEVTATGAHANLAIKDTPHNNFKATVEVPQTADLVLHLTAGNLEMAAIAGNKNIDSKAGNVTVVVGDSSNYSSVDASVTAGNLDAGPFGKADSGIGNHFKWSGSGKYTLHASLGAGNLELKSK
jgi:hypothetical protein